VAWGGDKEMAPNQMERRKGPKHYVVAAFQMPPKSGEQPAKSPLLKPREAPKSPKCSPKFAPSHNVPSSPQLRPLTAGNSRAVIPVASHSLGVVIGKEGKTLHRMERMFGVNLKVHTAIHPLTSKPSQHFTIKTVNPPPSKPPTPNQMFRCPKMARRRGRRF